METESSSGSNIAQQSSYPKQASGLHGAHDICQADEKQEQELEQDQEQGFDIADEYAMMSLIGAACRNSADRNEDAVATKVKNQLHDESASSISRIRALYRLREAPLINREKMFKDEPVADLHQLKPGDHIFWDGQCGKYYRYFHHMIVVEVDHQMQTFAVIEHTVRTLKAIIKTMTTAACSGIKQVPFMPNNYEEYAQTKRSVINSDVYDAKTCRGIVRKKTLRIIDSDTCATMNNDSSLKKERKTLLKREYLKPFRDFVEYFYKHHSGLNVEDLKVDYSPQKCVDRATALLGDRNYQLFSSNCEHFVSYCCTGLHFSQQILILDKVLYRLEHDYGLTSGHHDFLILMRFACWRQGKNYFASITGNVPGITVTARQSLELEQEVH